MTDVTDVIPKSERVLPKILVIAVATLMSVGIGAGIVFVGINSFIGDPKTYAEVMPGFATEYGVRNVTKPTEKSEVVTGLPSKTLSFEAGKTLNGTEPPYATEYMGGLVSEFENNDPINLLAYGKNQSDEGKIEFDFYSATKKDYTGDTYNRLNNIFTSLYENGTGNLKIVSTPTVNGSRATDITITIPTSSSSVKSVYESTLNSISRSNLLDGKNLFTLTVQQSGNAEQQYPGTKVKSFFYDDNTFQNAKNINILIWDTLDNYGDEAGFDFMNITNRSYEVGLKPTDSKLTLILQGDQPDAGTTNDIAGRFREEARTNDRIYFPYSYITALRYENSEDDFFTEYATNIEPVI
jgi:hypothetical protein